MANHLYDDDNLLALRRHIRDALVALVYLYLDPVA